MTPSDTTLEQRLAELERKVNPKPASEVLDLAAKDAYLRALNNELAFVSGTAGADAERR